MKYEHCQEKSTENRHFYSPDKSLYVAWACFRNDYGVIWCRCTMLSSQRVQHRMVLVVKIFDLFIFALLLLNSTKCTIRRLYMVTANSTSKYFLKYE